MMQIWLGVYGASITICRTVITSFSIVSIARRKAGVRFAQVVYRNGIDPRAASSKTTRSQENFSLLTGEIGERGGSIDRWLIALLTKASYYSHYG